MSMMTTTDSRSQVAMPLPQQIAAKEQEFLAVLPPQITPRKFMGVVLTAIRNAPGLAKADRQSFFISALRAAQDGLLPDGREGALVIYGGKVQWLPMVAGIKKRVRQSGEIATWDAQVVRQKDVFEYEFGDKPFIRHKPSMDADRGPIIAAYSVATLKSGEISREVMTKAQLDQVKRASKSSANGPWKDWEEEMCRKSVLKRHAKSLPMSTEVGDVIRRDNENDHFDATVAASSYVIDNPLSDEDPIDSQAGNHDPDTGEIHEDAPQDQQGASESSPRDAVLDRLRAAAMDSPGKLKRVLGGLSKDEQALVTPEDRALLEATAAQAGAS